MGTQEEQPSKWREWSFTCITPHRWLFRKAQCRVQPKMSLTPHQHIYKQMTSNDRLLDAWFSVSAALNFDYPQRCIPSISRRIERSVFMVSRMYVRWLQGPPNRVSCPSCIPKITSQASVLKQGCQDSPCHAARTLSCASSQRSSACPIAVSPATRTHRLINDKHVQALWILLADECVCMYWEPHLKMHVLVEGHIVQTLVCATRGRQGFCTED